MLILNIISAVLLLIIAGNKLTMFTQKRNPTDAFKAILCIMIALFFMISNLGLANSC